VCNLLRSVYVINMFPFSSFECLSIFFSYRDVYTYFFTLRYYILYANAYLNLSSITRAFLTQGFEAQLIPFYHAFSLILTPHCRIFEHRRKFIYKTTCCTLYRQYFNCHKKKERNWLEFPFSFRRKLPHKIFLSSFYVINVNYKHKKGFMINWIAIILKCDNLNTFE
jgi:hypothetical protein